MQFFFFFWVILYLLHSSKNRLIGQNIFISLFILVEIEGWGNVCATPFNCRKMDGYEKQIIIFATKVLGFLYLRLLIVLPALSGVVFCLDFGPFFFSSLVPLSDVFSFYLFISNSTIHCGHEEGLLLTSDWIH
jgi:hypothetical protein